ncbi:endo-1,4-beta-xylanase [Agathobacter rectalis]|nr:endo-1,4-beta-xylanase [Agathobacter rectalis]
MKRKKLLKQGACIAVCSTMLATGVTQLIPAYQAQSLVFADEVQQNIKKTTYTADKLTVDWGNAGYELTDGVWKVTFNNQYDQVKWRLPETVDMSTVKSVTFNVKDQKGSVSLKVYKNGDEDADGANTKYELTGADEYSISPTGEGDMVAVGLMTTDNAGSGSAISLVSVTVETDTTPKTPPEIEQNIEDWKKSVTSSDALGENAIAGTGIMLDEIKDNTLMDLVEKHFNAVTFGNELKPDALFNYQLEKSVKTKTVQFDGQDLEVPMVNDAGDSLDFSRADAMVDKILEWNAAHPDRKIRIRGHVLVWHSQTPEWFFHENYDISKPYVDKETMNRRLEWYISSVFDHYFGEAANKKYDGLFYGWDVVNEAVIGNTYRTDTVSPAESLDEIRHGNNSSWWHVYKSNEFIINAFKYANKYAPSDVELYYNDFGETDNIKSEGIIKLISDVKSAQGTRLDAFGMQAHYSVDSFSAAQFKTVAKKYAEAAGKVQLTELDFQASAAYKSGAASKESEYTKMAYCHKQLFDAAKDLKKNGTNVAGITVWGVIEPNSWLHSQSNVGGGADGSKQCPLLFDGKYKAKPAYWAYVDATKLEPLIQDIVVAEQKGDTMSGTEYSFSDDDTQAAFIPTWDKDGLNVLVSVKDATINDTDEVTVYVDETNSAGDVTPVKKTVKRSEAQAVDGGYRATIKVPMTDLKVAKTIGMDVKVMNNDKAVSFNDLKEMQETSSKYYAKATLKPGIEKATKATVKIDGEADSEWDKAVAIPLTINLGAKVTADAKVLWDDENLYVYATVKDPVLNKDGGEAYQQDSLEVFIDENNAKTESYDDDDKQYRINYENEHSFNGKKCLEDNVQSVAKVTGDGYVIEAAFKWTDIQPKKGDRIGLEFQINDADASGTRIGTLSWNDETGMGWSKSSVYGTIELTAEPTPEPEPTPAPTPDPTPAPTPDPTPAPTPDPTPDPTPAPTPATGSTKSDVKQTAEGATISHNVSETDKANAGITVTNNKPDIADASLESVKADLKVNDVKDISVIDVFDVKAPANYDGNPIWITLDANYSADYSVLHFQDGKWVVLETRKSSDGKLQAKFTKFSPTAIVSIASKASTKPTTTKTDAKKAAKTSDQSATAAFIVLFLAGVSMAGASRLRRSRKQS